MSPTRVCEPSGSPHPLDYEERRMITEALDTNLLVEAAAGTGKTSAMIERMLALLRSGSCPHINHMAAVTFTRKAAAEIRSRFLAALEEAWRGEKDGPARERLGRALENFEQCFVGTIHSFCARIIRERPLEAGVGLRFREIEELEDGRLRQEAWREYCSRLYLNDPSGLLGRLEGKGLRLSDLESAFLSYAEFPDVDDWPVPAPEIDPLLAERARRELEDYVSHMQELGPRLPATAGTDSLIPELRRLPRVISHYRLENTAELMEALEHLDKNVKLTLKVWVAAGMSREEAKMEKERWERFRSEVVLPTLTRWRESRYSTCLEALRGAREVYDSLRRERRSLNFQDLLMEAARLLRDYPWVREELRERYTHLLVDEFQDTDPVQAEIIFLLTSTDPGERDWRRCVPRAGSLFLVGDPKQSIYRFRRADISIYNEVKDMLQRSGGAVVNLRANFRSLPQLLRWVNSVFSPTESGDAGEDTGRFPSRATESSPAYVELIPSCPDPAGEGLRGIYRLTVPAEIGRNDEALLYLAERIAGFISHACSNGLSVFRRDGRDGSWTNGPAQPSDFLVLTYRKEDLAAIAAKLQEYGVPCRVSGGESLNRVPEIRLLYLCLRAALRPEDPVALLAALRSELFGLSDAELYAFKKAGGAFSYRTAVPPDLEPRIRGAFEDAFGRLDKYRRWFHRLPLMAALERMVDDLGLPLSAAFRPGGDVQAGSLAKALEVLREDEDEIWTTTQLLDRMESLARNRESYDGISVLSEEPPAVRVMNLHKAKGLEAPVVFLAGVRGSGAAEPDRHIDRTQGKTRGYLAVYRRISRHKRKLVAHPENWEELAEREQEFLRAEALRLLYVAATRASSACVIAIREKSAATHPWNLFMPHLEGVPELPEPPSPGEKAGPVAVSTVAQPDEFPRAWEQRLERFLHPAYRVTGARDLALSSDSTAEPLPPIWREHVRIEDCTATRSPSPASTPNPSVIPTPPDPVRRAGDAGGAVARALKDGGPDRPSPHTSEPEDDGDRGQDFGEVVHLLLQAAAEGRPRQLETLASSLLEERGLDPALAPEACGLAQKVLASPLWERALASPERLVEVPFHYLENDLFTTPTLVRGAVDLAFREDDGWVLVDYKTDRVVEGKAEHLARKYLPQLRLYAHLFEKILGEPVKESYLYLVEADRVYRITGV